jgi:hypothetical protein
MALSKFGIHTHDTTRECVLSLQRMGGSDILLGCERVGGGGRRGGSDDDSVNSRWERKGGLWLFDYYSEEERVLRR